VKRISALARMARVRLEHPVQVTVKKFAQVVMLATSRMVTFVPRTAAHVKEEWQLLEKHAQRTMQTIVLHVMLAMCWREENVEGAV